MDTVGEREGGMSLKNGIDMYTLPSVKWITLVNTSLGKLLCSRVQFGAL